MSTSSFLARAVADARRATDARTRHSSPARLRAAAAVRPPALGLRDRLAAARATTGQPALIAEVKRRSPSVGVIRADLDAAAQAAAYERGGASAVSVLTEPEHFAGSPDDLRAARDAVAIPLLRKDFVTTADQVWEARAWGADAVLLIVAALDPVQLRDLLAEAAGAGLDALVEVHDEDEADTAGAAGATLVGVNARDLRTLGVDLGRFAQVAGQLPADAVLVAESGVRTRTDVETMAAAGAHAVLVGETLVRAPDPAAAAAALLGRPMPAPPTAGAPA